MKKQTQTLADSFNAWRSQELLDKAKYRSTSKLYKLREVWRSRKTSAARDKAKAKFFEALQARFPEGSIVNLEGGVMSKSKHTPGPWEIIGPCIPMMSHTIVAKSQRNPELKGIVAHVEQQNDIDSGETEDAANAALLAAAPEMLAILKELVEYRIPKDERAECIQRSAALHSDICDAMRIIARAEGRDK